MSATSVTGRGRVAAERIMIDACRIERRDGTEPTLDHATARIVRTGPNTLYTGVCRIKPSARLDRVVEAGETPITHRRYTVSVPITVQNVTTDDWIVITTCQLDPALVGVELRIRSFDQGSFITARRLECEVAVSEHQR
jgi:hypothetical protein